MRPTLLIVDDHAGFRASARRLLEAEGFAVVGEVDGARSALPAVARLSPDVVLVDIALPDGDGFDVCADAGVAAVIQPGGSVNDAESIAAADERGIAMVFTGERHFRH